MSKGLFRLSHSSIQWNRLSILRSVFGHLFKEVVLFIPLSRFIQWNRITLFKIRVLLIPSNRFLIATGYIRGLFKMCVLPIQWNRVSLFIGGLYIVFNQKHLNQERSGRIIKEALAYT